MAGLGSRELEGYPGLESAPPHRPVCQRPWREASCSDSQRSVARPRGSWPTLASL